MKYRKGFVSNSSSSSFLVAFPRFPKTKDDIKKMVFGNKKLFKHPYGDGKHYPYNYPVSEIVDIIWDDIKRQIPNNMSVIFSMIHNVLTNKWDDYWAGDDWLEDNWEEDNKTEVRKFLDKYKGSYFYIFKYSDDDGPLGCAMEHGDLFNKLPHIISSNH